MSADSLPLLKTWVPSGYRQMMSFLDRDKGVLIFSPKTCKERVLSCTASHLAWENRSVSGFAAKANTFLNRDRPTAAIYGSSDKKKRMGEGRQIEAVLSSLCYAMDRPGPTVYLQEGSEMNAIYVEVDGIFIKAPVMTHALFTFIRAALNYAQGFVEEDKDIKKWIKKFRRYSSSNDSMHLRDGDGTVQKMLTGTLACLKYDGLDAWKANVRAKNTTTSAYNENLGGIVNYSDVQYESALNRPLLKSL